MPVTEKMVLSEYQVMREILLTFKSPTTCGEMPLFTYDSNRHSFTPNPGICIPSLLSQSLQSYMTQVCSALSAKRILDSFVDSVLCCSSAPLPPLTFEAYAEGLSDIMDLFSSDLVELENKGK